MVTRLSQYVVMKCGDCIEFQLVFILKVNLYNLYFKVLCSSLTTS